MTAHHPLRSLIFALLGFALAGGLAACSRATPPASTPRPATDSPASTDSVAAAAATDPAAVVPDGSPRLVDSAAGSVHVQYRVYGAGEPLLVLIHGWSCDSNYWQAQVADLKSRYTVATVDLAGHGGSGANRSDWSMAAFGADVAAVVAALPKHPQVVLVGHSMGGPVMVEAARQIGPRVIGLIGVDTLKNIGLPRPHDSALRPRLAALEQDFIGTTRAMVESSLFAPGSDPTLMRRIADDMSQAPPAVAIPAMRALLSWDGADTMRALSVPIVAINADLGGVTDEARIRKQVPDFRAVTVPGLGHFLMMEDPARFNPILDTEIRALLQHAAAAAAG
ncbi:MAG: alpha/beta hydrolase [Sinobacteraceae bacterium]|nr:alpha/beta hydrolase [Nevskiaceae bacterium]MCP5466457.1 alpha/beta hydrolase [Nevskiaceae bacterium]